MKSQFEAGRFKIFVILRPLCNNQGRYIIIRCVSAPKAQSVSDVEVIIKYLDPVAIRVLDESNALHLTYKQHKRIMKE